MASIKVRARRLFIAVGIASAAAIAPVVAVIAGPGTPDAAVAQVNCPAGEDWDIYLNSCVPHTAPGPVPQYPATVNGIPCVGRNADVCRALSQNDPAVSVPRPNTTVQQSP